MKNQAQNINKLIDIIPSNYPALMIAHFSHKDNTLVEELYKKSIKDDIEYQINFLGEDIEQLKQKYQNPLIKIIKFNLDRAKYMIQGKIYDFVFVTTPIEDIDTFLQKVHPIIKNSGNIIILLNKTEPKDSWLSLLEKNYFVATSVIDNLIEDTNIIISKKMHGWK
jgi:ketopantoate reductase